MNNQSRRNFIRNSFAVAAGFTIVPRHVLGRGYLAPSDQLTKAMRMAKERGCFVPWTYVFADASVTGRTQLRRGYRGWSGPPRREAEPSNHHDVQVQYGLLRKRDSS